MYCSVFLCLTGFFSCVDLSAKCYGGFYMSGGPRERWERSLLLINGLIKALSLTRQRLTAMDGAAWQTPGNEWQLLVACLVGDRVTCKGLASPPFPCPHSPLNRPSHPTLLVPVSSFSSSSSPFICPQPLAPFFHNLFFIYHQTDHTH